MQYSINGKPAPIAAIGTWAWGGGMNGGRMIFGTVTYESALMESFDIAYALGYTLWDTAAVYGMGNAERILAKCIQGKPIILSDKFTPMGGFSEKAIEKALAGSVKHLHGLTPDIYWLHSPKHIGENLAYFCELQKQGRIGSIGVSNFNLEQICQAQALLANNGLQLGGVQNHFSLIYRKSERAGILHWCEEHDVPFFSYMTLEQGALTGRYNGSHGFPACSRRGLAFPNAKLHKLEPLHAELEVIGKEHGLSIPETAMVWAISKNTIPIIGITKPNQAQALSHITGKTLSTEEMLRLEEAASKTGIEIAGSWEPKE